MGQASVLVPPGAASQDQRAKSKAHEVSRMKLWGSVIVFVGYLLALFGVTVFAAEPTKVLLAHGAISNNVEPLWIAKEQGIFRNYGMELDLALSIAGQRCKR